MSPISSEKRAARPARIARRRTRSVTHHARADSSTPGDLGHRRRVDRDEGLICARAVAVQRSGDELLAGTDSPVIGRSTRLRQAPTRGKLLLDCALRVCQVWHGHSRLALRVRSRQSASDQLRRLGRIERLGQVLERAPWNAATADSRSEYAVMMMTGRSGKRSFTFCSSSAECLACDVRTNTCGAPLRRGVHGLSGLEQVLTDAFARAPFRIPADGTVVVDDPTVHHVFKARSTMRTVLPGWLSHSLTA